MRPLGERLTIDVLVGDGALGTMLLGRGLAPGKPPESVTRSRPELVREISERYREAGADLLTTTTFGGSPIKLALHRMGDDVDAINRGAVELARTVAAGRAYVVGSCGPSGRLLVPFGDTTAEAMYASFRRQAELLTGAGVDGVVVETMTDLTEATLAVRAVKEVSPTVPVLATMTFDPTPRGYFTIMGVSVAAAAAGLADAGADAVGSNCGNGIEHMVAIAREFRRHTTLPLVIQPNAGLPRTVGRETVYDETPEFMAEHARGLLDLGVAVIGGCCGTTPAHTAALRAMIDRSARPAS